MQLKKFLISLLSILIVSGITIVVQILTDYLFVRLNPECGSTGSYHYRIVEMRQTSLVIIPLFTVISVFVWELLFQGLKDRTHFWDYFFCGFTFFLVSFLFVAPFGNIAHADSYTAKYFFVITTVGGVYPLLRLKLRNRFSVSSNG